MSARVATIQEYRGGGADDDGEATADDGGMEGGCD